VFTDGIRRRFLAGNALTRKVIDPEIRFGPLRGNQSVSLYQDHHHHHHHHIVVVDG